MRSRLVAAWIVLACAGGTMATFNIWHAWHSGVNQFLAVMTGAVVVVVVVGTSHVISGEDSGWFQAAVWVAMAGGMVLSVRATQAIVEPVFGRWVWWMFAVVVDGSALLCLRAVLTRSEPEPAAAPAGPDVAPPADPGPEEKKLPAEGRRARGPSRVTPAEEKARHDARRAYRKSLAEGEPISERQLAAKFGRERGWARVRIREVKNGPAQVAS